jgi:hypothetical protein
MASQMKAMVVAFFLGFFAAACSILPSASPATYSDPFAYCAAVGTADSPGLPYTGPKLPDSIVQRMIAQGIVSADAPPDFQKNAVWRCMDHQVWVCQYGANLPCEDMADTSTVPSSEIQDFCTSNLSADTIPAVVAGRDTVYEWQCSSGKPEIVRQVFQVDPRGFIANFWYQLTAK